MDDDELALLGPPWAKEGNLQSRLYWESTGKKAKKKDWRKVFVVVQKGELSMFTFEGTKSGNFGGSVGGGNWTVSQHMIAYWSQSTANTVGAMSLIHAVASGLPKPGYNNSRPHCLSLTLPGGEGWFFQAGTEDLVAEWVQTCNYWAARISRQPLQGGVSNMEYGWSRALDSVGDDDDKASIKSSRSSLSKFTGTYGRRGSVPADKIHINDWRPPPPATMPSPLDEENQLEALASYVKRLEVEHEQHQAIEEPMSRLVSD
jgi:PH/SEC7 domain-containing protein